MQHPIAEEDSLTDLLFEAIDEGNLSTVEALLAMEIDLGERIAVGESEMTGLQFAVDRYAPNKPDAKDRFSIVSSLLHKIKSLTSSEESCEYFGAHGAFSFAVSCSDLTQLFLDADLPMDYTFPVKDIIGNCLLLAQGRSVTSPTLSSDIEKCIELIKHGKPDALCSLAEEIEAVQREIEKIKKHPKTRPLLKTRATTLIEHLNRLSSSLTEAQSEKKQSSSMDEKKKEYDYEKIANAKLGKKEKNKQEQERKEQEEEKKRDMAEKEKKEQEEQERVRKEENRQKKQALQEKRTRQQQEKKIRKREARKEREKEQQRRLEEHENLKREENESFKKELKIGAEKKLGEEPEQDSEEEYESEAEELPEITEPLGFSTPPTRSRRSTTTMTGDDLLYLREQLSDVTSASSSFSSPSSTTSSQWSSPHATPGITPSSTRAHTPVLEEDVDIHFASSSSPSSTPSSTQTKLSILNEEIEKGIPLLKAAQCSPGLYFVMGIQVNNLLARQALPHSLTFFCPLDGINEKLQILSQSDFSCLQWHAYIMVNEQEEALLFFEKPATPLSIQGAASLVYDMKRQEIAAVYFSQEDGITYHPLVKPRASYVNLGFRWGSQQPLLMYPVCQSSYFKEEHFFSFLLTTMYSIQEADKLDILSKALSRFAKKNDADQNLTEQLDILFRLFFPEETAKSMALSMTSMIKFPECFNSSNQEKSISASL